MEKIKQLLSKSRLSKTSTKTNVLKTADNPGSVNRQRLPDEGNEDQNQMTVAGPSNRQTAPIFTLTDGCYDEIFNYLSTKDLNSIGQTCKAMQNVAGKYFKRNFSGAQQYIRNDGIYIRYSDYEGASNKFTPISGFNRYITRISYCFEEFFPLRYIESHSDEFDSVKSLFLSSVRVNELVIKKIQKILPKIECVKLYRNWICSDCIYDILLIILH